MAAASRPSGGVYDQMVKKLVRLALASEYSRQPVRRNDITAKGLFCFVVLFLRFFFFLFSSRDFLGLENAVGERGRGEKGE